MKTSIILSVWIVRHGGQQGEKGWGKKFTNSLLMWSFYSSHIKDRKWTTKKEILLSNAILPETAKKFHNSEQAPSSSHFQFWLSGGWDEPKTKRTNLWDQLSDTTAGGRQQLGKCRHKIVTREAGRMADIVGSILNFFFLGACCRLGTAL